MEPKETVSLCVICGACPAVEVYEDVVKIGEAGNQVTLKQDEWNTLVDLIEQGALRRQ